MMKKAKGTKNIIKDVCIGVVGGLTLSASMILIFEGIECLYMARRPKSDRVKLYDDIQKDYSFMMTDNEELCKLLENAE